MFNDVVKSFCEGVKITVDKLTMCGNFTVLPRDMCYPITYWEFEKFYEEKSKNFVLQKLNSTGAFFTHIWNKMQDFGNKHFQLIFTSDSAYMNLAKKLCPNTFHTLVKYF